MNAAITYFTVGGHCYTDAGKLNCNYRGNTATENRLAYLQLFEVAALDMSLYFISIM